jgi:hypothetical protein
VFIGRDRLDEVMAIEELHVVDGADSPPDRGFQQRTTEQVHHHRRGVTESSRPVQFMPGHPYRHPGEVAVIAYRRAGGDEFGVYAGK